MGFGSCASHEGGVFEMIGFGVIEKVALGLQVVAVGFCLIGAVDVERGLLLGAKLEVEGLYRAVGYVAFHGEDIGGGDGHGVSANGGTGLGVEDGIREAYQGAGRLHGGREPEVGAAQV